MNRFIFFSSEDLTSDNWSEIERYREIIQLCYKLNIPVFLITRCSLNEELKFKKKFGEHILIFQNYDETGLRMISRSNPSLILIEKGRVVEKYTSYNLPDSEDLKSILEGPK